VVACAAVSTSSPAPRIPPLPESDQDEQAKELLGGVSVGSAPASNIFSTLVRHPGLFRRWLPFGGKLLGGGKLPARDRELLILRTGWLCQAEYEWAQHREISRSIGIGDDEIAAVREGPGAFEGFDATLMRAADELHEQSRISDDTWAKLAERYDERQLIEVPMLVGHYHMVAFTLNSLGVPLEQGLAGFEG
jgi:alkylhydroperoxidase family enzyme